MTLVFSRRLALAFGLLLPVAETIRRWHQLMAFTHLISWLDDVLLGALLLYAAWRMRRDTASGQRALSAAWGCACGMGYYSFFGQLFDMDRADPAPIPVTWVVAIKGAGFALAILALIGSLRETNAPAAPP